MTVSFLETGFCKHPEFAVKQGGSFSPVKFYSTVGVIHHPKHGVVLFDTGYSSHFFEATTRYPERLYAKITPVHSSPELTAAAQLAANGIDPQDVNYIVLSHFHGDHIAGVRDFPRAKLIFLEQGYRELQEKSRLKALLRHAFLPALLPLDFDQRALPLTASAIQKGITPFQVFPDGYDIFGDGSILGIPLPGHALGHMGLYIPGNDPYFLVADACWVEAAFTEKKLPHFIARLITSNHQQYLQTIAGIEALYYEHQKVKIVPCHCDKTWQDLPKIVDEESNACFEH